MPVHDITKRPVTRFPRMSTIELIHFFYSVLQVRAEINKLIVHSLDILVEMLAENDIGVDGVDVHARRKKEISDVLEAHCRSGGVENLAKEVIPSNCLESVNVGLERDLNALDLQNEKGNDEDEKGEKEGQDGRQDLRNRDAFEISVRVIDKF